MKDFRVRGAVAFIALFCVAAGASEEPAAFRALMKGKLLMKSGVSKWDRSLFQQACELFELAAQDSAYAAWGQYYLGYCHFRLGNYALQTGQRVQARHAFEQAAEHLKNAMHLRDAFAEAQALLAVCYGQRAVLEKSKAANLIATGKQLMGKAVELAPENPRVRFLQALAIFHTPEFLGGNPQKTIALLQKAAQLFITFRSEDVLAPQWGHAECYAWLCKLHRAAGEKKSAKTACQHAFEINPAYIWVKQDLLPALEN